MLFLPENSQRLDGFKFIECHWAMIRLIFKYFIKKGIISALPPCPRYCRATGAAAPSALLVPACLRIYASNHNNFIAFKYNAGANIITLCYLKACSLI